MKIKKGDTVQVLSGNDKGKTGEVLDTMPKTDRIIVKGINIRKKHVKPRKVNVVCPKCNKPTRIKIEKEGKEKTRICKKCGAKLK